MNKFNFIKRDHRKILALDMGASYISIAYLERIHNECKILYFDSKDISSDDNTREVASGFIKDFILKLLMGLTLVVKPRMIDLINNCP